MNRYLIINADDYGSCHAANEAIEQLFNQGFLTSTTLMAPCPWAEDAVQRALRNQKINVGLHITTTCEYKNYKWGPVNHSASSLADKWGWFWPTAPESLAHATAEDMEKEINAQYAWMADRGLPPEHIDSHMGTVYGLDGPGYLEPVYRLCAAHGLHFRQPKELSFFMPGAPAEIQAMAKKAAAQAEAMGIGLPEQIFSSNCEVQPGDTYEEFRQTYLDQIERIPEGVSEMLLHPCVETPELKAINPRWQKRVWEYRLLLDNEVLRFIQDQGIILTTYGEAPFFGQGNAGA